MKRKPDDDESLRMIVEGEVNEGDISGSVGVIASQGLIAPVTTEV